MGTKICKHQVFVYIFETYYNIACDAIILNGNTISE